ncbi:MAG TPA: serine protease [Longimicrobium sp.]|nr:serine protease [Longimicrobium sp.]
MAIYDANDTRLDVYQVGTPAIVQQAAAVALVISEDDLVDNGDGTFSPAAVVFGQRTELVTGDPALLCPNQAFLAQPSAEEAYGTAWLVNSTLTNGLVVTAKHVLEAALSHDPLNNLRFAFAWAMTSATTPVRIPGANIYTAGQVVAVGAGNGIKDDWALIEVTAPVAGIPPLPLSAQNPQMNQALYCLSYPTQLPLKYSTGWVNDVTAPELFRGPVTAFGGSSGAPVLDAATRTVQGVYVHGPVDYEVAGPCVVASNYPSNDVTEAGRMIRVQQFQGSIP